MANNDANASKKLAAPQGRKPDRKPNPKDDLDQEQLKSLDIVGKIDFIVNNIARFSDAARGVGAAAHLVQVVSKLINDPKFYAPKKMPGSPKSIQEVSRDQMQDANSPQSQRILITPQSESAAGYMTVAGAQIAKLNVFVGPGDQEGITTVIDQTFHLFEQKAKYTAPFSRAELGYYIGSCEYAMMLYVKLLTAVFIVNTNEAGNVRLADALYAAWCNSGSQVAHGTVLDDLGAHYDALRSELLAFAKFIENHVLWDAPIMAKILYAGTAMWSDSPQTKTNCMLINYVGRVPGTDPYTNDRSVNMIVENGYVYDVTATDILLAARKFRMQWSESNSKIAAKLSEAQLTKPIKLYAEKLLDCEYPILYDKEINAQLRNALMPQGMIHSDEDNIIENIGFPTYVKDGDPTTNLQVPVFCNPADFKSYEGIKATSVMLKPDDTTGLRTARYFSVFTRTGSNHVQTFFGTSAETLEVSEVGLVSTDDFKLDSDEHIASSCAMVPYITVYPGSHKVDNKSNLTADFESVEMPISLNYYVDDDTSFWAMNTYYYSPYQEWPDQDYPQFNRMLTNITAMTNWRNLPVHDLALFPASSPQCCVRRGHDFTGTLISNQGFNMLYTISGSQLKTIKRNSAVGLHMPPAIYSKML